MEFLMIVITITIAVIIIRSLKKKTNSTVITFKSTNGEIPENMKEMMEKNFQDNNSASFAHNAAFGCSTDNRCIPGI